MRHNTLPVLVEWRAHPGLGRAYSLVAILAAALGITLVVGGEQRASADAFDTIRELGGPVAWGFVLVAGAAALVAAAVIGGRWVQVALFCGSVVHCLLALWFFLAANHIPTASYWGSIIFFVLALWHLSQAFEYTPPRS